MAKPRTPGTRKESLEPPVTLDRDSFPRLTDYLRSGEAGGGTGMRAAERSGSRTMSDR